MRRFLFSAPLVACLAVAAQAQTIWYVDGAAATNGSGMNWGSPFNNIPSAVFAASDANTPQDEIWVKAGTYKPASSSSTFQLKANVGIYGGVVGTETSRTQRDIDTNETILSGELPPSSGFGDNVEVVVTETRDSHLLWLFSIIMNR